MPEITAETQEFMRNLLVNDDPYKAVKEASTRVAMALLPSWQARAASDGDPLGWALRLSAAGNLIDCGPTGRLNVEEIDQRIQCALQRPIPIEDVETFRNRLEKASNLLLIADNAGELVADRVLLEVIERRRPGLPITVMVRGGPVLNDATREEIRSSGLPGHWSIIDTHARIPGLPLRRSPAEVVDAFRRAGLIIAKGQGNLETLSEIDHSGLFFLLTCKCPSIAGILKTTVGTAVLRQSTPGSSLSSRPESPSSDYPLSLEKLP